MSGNVKRPAGFGTSCWNSLERKTVIPVDHVEDRDKGDNAEEQRYRHEKPGNEGPAQPRDHNPYFQPAATAANSTAIKIP